jgi:hypothetical protein
VCVCVKYCQLLQLFALKILIVYYLLTLLFFLLFSIYLLLLLFQMMFIIARYHYFNNSVRGMRIVCVYFESSMHSSVQQYYCITQPDFLKQ